MSQSYTCLPDNSLLLESHSRRVDVVERANPTSYSLEVANGREHTARVETCRSTARRPPGSNRLEEFSRHSRPIPPGRPDTATHIAHSPALAPGSPRAAPARPRVRRRCARGLHPRATAARGRRLPPPGSTAGASAPPRALPPPRARLGSSCRLCDGRGRANRFFGIPSNSTCGFASRRDRATPPTVRERRDGAGAHCVVPHGRFSKVFGFAPQIVQVSRSASALARAFFASYSRCFFS